MGWLSGWANRFKITVDDAVVDADLVDFPLPVFLNNGCGKTDFDASAIFAALNPQNTVTKTTMVSWYKGDLDTGKFNDSTGSRDLTLSGAGCYSSDDLWDKVMVFDGTAYATAVDSPNLGKDFTIAFWFKTSAAPARQDFCSIGNVSVAEAGLMLGLDNGIPCMERAGAARITGSCRALNDGLWHHLAITCQNGATVLYADGVKCATATWSSANIGGSALRVGGINHSTPYAYTGRIADFRVLSNYLSRADILDLMRGGFRKIAITGEDGETEKYVEVASWSAAKRQAVLYTKANLNGSSDTVLYLYFDPAKANNANVNEPGVGNAINVWDSNFVAVHHMFGDINAAGGMIDSTANAANGIGASTELGDHEPLNGPDGMNRINIDGAGEGIDLGANASKFDFATSALTLEAFFNANAVPNNAGAKLIEHDHNGSSPPYISWGLGQSASTTKLTLEVNTTAGGLSAVVATNSYTAGANLYAAGVYDGSTQKLYDNEGAENGSAAKTGTLVYNATPKNVRIGNSRLGTGDCFNGKIMEARISRVVRSAAWIKLTAKSLNDQAVTVTSAIEFMATAALGMAFSLVDPATGTLIVHQEGAPLVVAMALKPPGIFVLPYPNVSLRATASKPRILVS